MSSEYKYKFSKVNGERYLQIWKDGKFHRSVGKAEKLNKLLVRHELLIEQTKKRFEKLTKIGEEILR